MSDYIERSVIERLLTIAAAGDGDKKRRTWAKAICVLHDAPAADAAPIKHGVWKKTGYAYLLRCSACRDCYIDDDWLDGKNGISARSAGRRLTEVMTMRLIDADALEKDLRHEYEQAYQKFHAAKRDDEKTEYGAASVAWLQAIFRVRDARSYGERRDDDGR